MNISDILGLAVPATYLLFYLVEQRWPARSFPRVRGWGFVGLGFLLAMMTMGVVIPGLLPLEWISERRLIDGSGLGVVGGGLVGFVSFELVIYGYHRASHALHLVWRFSHQMHHSPQRLDTPGAFVFHPLELVLQNVLFLSFTIFVLGLDPLAVSIIGYLLAFCGMFQHWNVRTPRWLGYLIQRPESHCGHHQLGVHASNYSDLPLWDMLLGTFDNPATFDGRVGFESRAAFGPMLLGVDVNTGRDVGAAARASRTPTWLPAVLTSPRPRAPTR